ncbi:MAG: endonuclease/exonuclease/phosphatase family protein [Gammaproteobacteria bacterium]|nr:endonuclease/exonuclease/phosphatase family protein [Gammaproteobacteria bacterium]
MRRIYRPALIVLFLMLVGCAPMPGTQPESGTKITIMAFNVENLFDTDDDPGKNDATYLPLAKKQSAAHKAGCAEIDNDYWREQCLYWDWNEEVVRTKLTRLADVIRQVNNGRGADVIALQEVENIKVLERLRTEHLGDLGYQPSVLIEGRDDRGIDVAFLSKLPLAGEPVLHEIPFRAIEDKRKKDTRGILQADFLLPDGNVLTGFSVHFPAPYHPFPLRIDAYRFLGSLQEGLPAGRLAFAAGDFNTPAREDDAEDMLGQYAEPWWLVAHEIECNDCPGTNYYRVNDSWSFLDMILLSRNFLSGGQWGLVRGSVKLANNVPAQVTDEGTPRRFRMPQAEGVSDHWPLILTIAPK